jgi:hypothetical protein
MTTKFEYLRKSAGGAAMVLAMSGAGLGLGSGIAQADLMNPMIPDPHHQVVTIINGIHDRIADRFNRDLTFINRQFQRNCERFDTRLDLQFEGTFTDGLTDHVCGTM